MKQKLFKGHTNPPLPSVEDLCTKLQDCRHFRLDCQTHIQTLTFINIDSEEKLGNIYNIYVKNNYFSNNFYNPYYLKLRTSYVNYSILNQCYVSKLRWFVQDTVGNANE